MLVVMASKLNANYDHNGSLAGEMSLFYSCEWIPILLVVLIDSSTVVFAVIVLNDIHITFQELLAFLCLTAHL